jgi:hypothetical protein
MAASAILMSGSTKTAIRRNPTNQQTSAFDAFIDLDG